MGIIFVLYLNKELLTGCKWRFSASLVNAFRAVFAVVSASVFFHTELYSPAFLC